MADLLRYCTKKKFCIAALQYSPLRPQNVCVHSSWWIFGKFLQGTGVEMGKNPVSLILYVSDYMFLNSLVVG